MNRLSAYEFMAKTKAVKSKLWDNYTWVHTFIHEWEGTSFLQRIHSIVLY